MKLKNFISGLELLGKYYDDDSYCIGAEHDQFFAYATSRPLSVQDVVKMFELGWFQSETDDNKYDAQDGWSAFV